MQTESSDAKPNKLSIPALNRLIDYSNDDEEEDEDDEPMTEEEFDNFIDRQMKKGKNSRCLDNELLAG